MTRLAAALDRCVAFDIKLARLAKGLLAIFVSCFECFCLLL